MAVKRKASEDLPLEIEGERSDIVEILPLGAGQEVGRSCIFLKYMGKKILLDCGIHPGLSGFACLPFFDTIDMEEVDVMLITHFHLDHCAAVPYVVSKTKFKGRILMTHPTKAIYNALMQDFVRVSRGGADDALFSEKDVAASLDRIEVVNYHQTVEVAGIKIVPYRAGHVLGAAMFQVEIAGLRVLYTGDYSRLSDRHLAGADLPDVPPHIVICEATYGTNKHLPIREREAKFLKTATEIVSRGGRLLLPVVALGRAQELLLMLEEHWNAHPELRGVPIYQISGLASKAMTIFGTYVDMMSDDIRAAFRGSKNPFQFHHIKLLKSPQEMDYSGPCVVMATPSMLQSGISRDLLEAWCENPLNGCIIADFAVQGTTARVIQGDVTELKSSQGQMLKFRMSVDVISFSAHADFAQTSEFLDTLRPPHVVLVHGEAENMARLKKALEVGAEAAQFARTVYSPRVNQRVHIVHKPQYFAKVVGRLADRRVGVGAPMRGLVVRQGFNASLIHPEDLPVFTKLHPGKVLQRQAVALSKPWSEVRLALEIMFEGVQGTADMGGVNAAKSSSSDQEALRVADAVTVTYMGPKISPGRPHVVLEWEGGALGDMTADAVVATILQASGEPHGLALAERERHAALAKGDTAAVEAAEMAMLGALLGSQYGTVKVDTAQGLVMVQADEKHVIVDSKSGTVDCADQLLKGRVEKSVARMLSVIRPAVKPEEEGV